MAPTKTATSGSTSGPSDFRSLVKRRISSLFGKPPKPTQIPKQGGYFTAELRPDGAGVAVDNLRNQPNLDWNAFFEAVNAVITYGDQTPRGNAMGPRLGDAELPCDSIEGWVAGAVYGKTPGDSVFRRITPLVRILQAAGVFNGGDGPVSLTDDFKDEIGMNSAPPPPPSKATRRATRRKHTKPRTVPVHAFKNRISGIG